MSDRESKYKPVILAAALLLNLFIAFYANIYYKTDIVYTHFFYLPIIIAGIWYHKKALLLAVFLSFVHVTVNFVASGGFGLSTVLRSLMFVAVALVVGVISEKKDRFYDELQKSTQQNKLILESVGEGIIGVDLQGNITFANPSALQMMGCTELDAVHGRHSIVNHLRTRDAKGAESQDSPIFLTMRDGTVRKITGWAFVKPDGTRTPVEYVCTPIRKYSRIIGAVIAAADITERMRLDHEIARFDRLDTIGRMAASLAHEIRNPLTTVRGFLQIYGSRQQDSTAKENFELMIEELDRANSIIMEYLSLGRNRVTQEKIQNLNSIVNAMAPLIMADAVNAGKQVNLLLEDIPDLLLDDKEIRQLILNLVNNGLEATPAGGKVTVKTYTDGGEVVLAVFDQGKGIEPEVLDKIGTPFFTTKEYGTGLGLAVCYSIVSRHNATMNIDTGPEGSVFTVRFRNGPPSEG